MFLADFWSVVLTKSVRQTVCVILIYFWSVALANIVSQTDSVIYFFWSVVLAKSVRQAVFGFILVSDFLLSIVFLG